MPKITDIKFPLDDGKDSEDKRVRVFIDGEYCTSIRTRTFKKMQADGIAVGTEISSQGLKDKEKFFWKESYGTEAWEKEKVRLAKVKNLIEGISPLIEATIIGFGADTNEFINHHPEVAGAPDLVVKLRNDDVVLLLVEVTGTEFMRGDPNCYWVRPDKINYVANHPDKDIWVILHFAKPVEKFVYIKPKAEKIYKFTSIDIRSAGERMVEFKSGDPEVRTEQEFRAHLIERAKEGAKAIVADIGWFTPSRIAFVEVYAASFLGAFAGSNNIFSPDLLPFDRALNMAVCAWEQFSEFVATRKCEQAKQAEGDSHA